jgi:hypothetical protein
VNILITAVVLTALGVLALLVLVLVGIRVEERHMSLTRAPSSCIEVATRRLLGVGGRTPGACRGNDQIPPRSELP